MGEPAAPGIPSLAAIQARLDQQIPQLYRDFALYLQVLREVLPASLDQACSHLATQVHPRHYSHLAPEARTQLHVRLKRLLSSCCSLLTVEQLHSLARQMEHERRRLLQRERARLLQQDVDLDGDSAAEPTPPGSIRLSLHLPLSPEFALPGQEPAVEEDFAEAMEVFPGDPGWAPGQLPREPLALIHCLDGLNAALSRRLRILSHSVNLELMRTGLLTGVLPVPLLDAVLAGQIDSLAAPANLLRLPLLPADPGRGSHPSMGLLLRTVDLEMEQPRLRTCRRRLQHHRQEILKMAETSQRLQRRLQAHHAQRLWRHDSQLNRPSEGT